MLQIDHLFEIVAVTALLSLRSNSVNLGHMYAFLKIELPFISEVKLLLTLDFVFSG